MVQYTTLFIINVIIIIWSQSSCSSVPPSDVKTWGGGRGAECLLMLFREIFADLPGKERHKKKGKNGEQKMKNSKGKEENYLKENERGKSMKIRRFLFCFCFCSVLLFTFWSHCNLFGVHQNGNFYQKRAFHTGKNQESDDPKWKLIPDKKYFTLGKIREVTSTPPPPKYSFYATVPTFLNINSLYNYLPISSLENSYHIVRQWCAFSPMGLTGIPHANGKLLCIIKHWYN